MQKDSTPTEQKYLQDVQKMSTEELEWTFLQHNLRHDIFNIGTPLEKPAETSTKTTLCLLMTSY